MTTDWISILPSTIPPLAAAAAALYAARGTDAERKRLKHDIELLEALPKESSAYAEALALVETRIKRLRSREDNGYRNFGHAVAGVVVTLIFGYLTAWGLIQGGWWTLLTPFSGFVAAAGLLMIVRALELGERDEKGNLKKYARPPRKSKSKVRS